MRDFRTLKFKYVYVNHDSNEERCTNYILRWDSDDSWKHSNNETWEVSQSYSSQDDSIMEVERKGTQLKVELSVFIICLVGW